MEDKKSNDQQPLKKQMSKINFSQFINEKTGSYNQDYKLGGLLGTGAFAQVRKVTNRKSKEIRAMKVIDKQNVKEEKDLLKLMNEIIILKKLDHPNILKIYEFFQDSLNFYIIIEICTGGELFDKIIEKGSISEKEASYIMKQLISAVYYAHKNNIVHRDLKPENILLDITADGGYNIKVIDWGAGKVIENGELLTGKSGTPYYIAPEVLKSQYNEKCDIWSCGVILFILLTGMPPFPGRNEKEIYKNILEKEINLNTQYWQLISPEAKNLVLQMLNRNYKQRLSAQEVLQHPWFETMAKAQSTQDNKEIMVKSISNLRSFRAEQKLQQAAVTFIASQLISKEEREQLLQTFKELDQNGDGILTRDEIYEGLKKIMSKIDAEKEVDRIMSVVDIDGSGAIDYTEFIAATLDRKKILTKERLKAAFNLFDKDGSGSITAFELKEVLGQKLTDVDDKYWEDIIKEVDKDGDGEVSLEEFIDLMMDYYD